MTVVMCQRVSHSCDIGCIYVLRTIFIHNINVKNQQIFWCNRNVWKYPDQADACICHEFVKRKRKAEARSIETQPLNVNQWNIINSWLFWVWCVLFSSKWYDTCYRALALTVPRIGGSVFNENCQMFKGNRFLCNSQFNNFPVNIKWSKYNTKRPHSYSLYHLVLQNLQSHIIYRNTLGFNSFNSFAKIFFIILVQPLRFWALDPCQWIKIRVLFLCAMRSFDCRPYITVHVHIFQSKRIVVILLSANFMKCELPVFNYWDIHSHLKVWN